jgi:hypothetical protein
MPRWIAEIFPAEVNPWGDPQEVLRAHMRDRHPAQWKQQQDLAAEGRA